MNIRTDTEVLREPVSVQEVQDEIDDVFTFNPPQTADNQSKCQNIQSLCKQLAYVIARDVPQGKEQTIAINSVLSAALYSNHGILRRQIVMAAIPLPPEENVT